MSGMFDRMREWFMPSDDDYHDDEYEAYDGLEETPLDIAPTTHQRKRGNVPSFQESKVLNIHKNSKMDIMNFTMLKYEVTGDICNYIKMRKPVVVNMEKLEKASAQRALDYLTGATFALDGSVEKIAENIFIFSPEHINVSTVSEELKQKTSFLLP